MIVGDSMMVGARAEDEVGNATAAATTLSACDGVSSVTSASSSEEWTTLAFIKGMSLGASCVLAQAAGLTDTIWVSVGPAGVTIMGPDVVGSGNDGAYTVVAVDRAGTELTGAVQYAWTSSNTARLAIDKDNGTVIGKSTGSVDVRLVAPGGANAKKTITIEPGVFAGTLSATSAAPGALVTATRAAGGPTFDDDVTAKLDATGTFIEGFTDNTLTFAVPATGSTAAGVLTLSNMGFEQIAQTTALTATKATADKYAPGNEDATCSGAGVPGAPEFSTIASSGNNVYFVHGGYGTGSGSRGACNGGTQVDHYFAYTAGASGETIDVELSWNDGSDVDLYVCTPDLGDCVGSGGGSGSSTGESVTDAVLAANTTYYIIPSMWSSGSNITNIKMHVTKK